MDDTPLSEAGYWSTYDAEADIYVAGRDPIGVNPLYMGWSKDGAVYFASELKALHTTTGFDGCQRIVEFPPGAVYTSRMDEPKVWYKPAWHDNAYLPTGALDFAELRQEVRACAAGRYSRRKADTFVRAARSSRRRW